ncbi:MAG: hypothetical protein KDK08_06360 [Rhizobiaceae bacterium]|nr:hypothetical protein [Rhizobiaceae bacterium]
MSASDDMVLLINIRRLVAEIELGIGFLAPAGMSIESALLSIVAGNLRSHLVSEGFFGPVPKKRGRRNSSACESRDSSAT